MSQDISIKEGGLSQQFGHINKLKVPQSGGGDTLWVPEDEVQTETLYVDKNGTYDAHTGIFTETITKTKKTKKGKKKKVTTYVQHYDEDLICYGWDEVDVNIIDSVTGKGSDGNLHNISVGDNDILQDDKIPSYIKIITPPKKTSYITGEAININGIEVMAYYEDDTEYGLVEPTNIRPLYATKSSSGDDALYSNGEGVNAIGLMCAHYQAIGGSYGYRYAPYLGHWTTDGKWGNPPNLYSFVFTTEEPEVVYYTVYDGRIYGCTKSGVSASGFICASEDGSSRFGGTPSYSHQGWFSSTKSASVDNQYFNSIISRIPESTVPPWEATKKSLEVSDSVITVEWEREDGEILSDSFKITVHDATPSGGDSGSGGSSGGSW